MSGKIFRFTSTSIYIFIDFVVVSLSIMAAYKLYRLSGIGQNVLYQKIEIVSVSLILALITVIVLHIFGTYRQESSVMNVAEIRDVIKGVTTAFVIFTIILVFGRLAVSRYILAFSYIFSLTSLVFVKTIFYHSPPLALTKTVGRFQKRILIYGAGELGQTLYRELANSPKLNIVPVGFIDDNLNRRHQYFYQSGVNAANSLPVLGGREDIKRLAGELHIDEVYVAMSNVTHSTLMDIMDLLRREKIKFCFVPNLYKIFVHKLKVNQIGQIPLIQEEESEVHKPYLYVKSCVDLMMALIIVTLLLPLFIIILLAIKMDSKGPVFFMHDRVGKDGKIYRMYKFRSMFRDVEPYAVNPLDQKDPRITRVGRFLRRMSLDEMPQIVNVLKGEMSLVGPRPEMPFIVAGYDEIHKERLKVLPGITGLWQLSGDRKKAIHENMDYDLYYMRNMSFFLDMAILIETCIFAFRGI